MKSNNNFHTSTSVSNSTSSSTSTSMLPSDNNSKGVKPTFDPHNVTDSMNQQPSSSGEENCNQSITNNKVERTLDGGQEKTGVDNVDIKGGEDDDDDQDGWSDDFDDELDDELSSKLSNLEKETIENNNQAHDDDGHILPCKNDNQMQENTFQSSDIIEQEHGVEQLNPQLGSKEKDLMAKMKSMMETKIDINNYVPEDYVFVESTGIIPTRRRFISRSDVLLGRS